MSPHRISEPTLRSKTDVVIIGAGPAGLTVAWWMARCGINTRIFDSRGTKVINGHADGLRERTQEILDSLGCGVQEKAEAEGHIHEHFKTWHHENDGQFKRISTLQVMRGHQDDMTTPFRILAISQGRVERFMVDAMEDLSASKMQVERGVVAESFLYDDAQENDSDGYPIEVVLRTLSDSEANPPTPPGALGGRDNIARANLPPDETPPHMWNPRTAPGTLETLQAKYLIGCDGAHSWLRQQLNYKTEGAHTPSVWGVLDVIPISNFPDMRFPAFIKNDYGTMMHIPRERNLSRLYIPIKDVDLGGRANRSSITLADLITRAKTFFAPYTFDVKVCEWWSVYQAGQRVAETNSHPSNRIFLAGDAVHMHSPKIGLGLNMSMQDGYNLGWKIAMAAAGAARDEAELLDTYHCERYPAAQKIVAYDRGLFGERGLLPPEELNRRHEEFRDFSSGLKLDYPESILISKRTGNLSAAAGLIIGESFRHRKVSGHATSQVHWTTKLLQSDGRFRILLMAGDVSRAEQMERVKNFCELLESNRKDRHGKETSLLHTRYPYCFTQPLTPKDKSLPVGQNPSITFSHERRRTSMISLLAIHSTVDTSNSISVFDFPAALTGPFDPEYHGYDFSRVLVDEPVHYDRYCDGRAYESWGIDRERGAVVIVRPDMHVGWIGEMEDTDALEAYFANILK